MRAFRNATLILITCILALLSANTSFAETKRKGEIAKKIEKVAPTVAPKKDQTGKALPIAQPANERATPAPSPAPGGSKSELSQVLGGKENENVPVYIKSDTLDLDTKGRIFTYRRNVQITKGDLVITADTVVGRYDAQNQIDTITCDDNVVITREERLRASSNHAVYDVKRGTIVMTEQPELNDRGNVLDADKVTIFIEEDRSEAEGNVRVKVLKSGDLSPTSALKK